MSERVRAGLAPTFQEIILRLQSYWASHGCVVMQPLDMELIEYFRENGTRLLVMEENTVSLGEKLALAANPCRVRSIALPTEPIPHASVARQRERYGFTEEAVTAILKELTEET